MQPADYWIEQLQLQAHPEGGYFRELYRSPEMIPASALPARFSGARCFATSIIYMLRRGERSVFHRIQSDETWHFQAGGGLELFELDESKPGELHRVVIGPDLHVGHQLQYTVPARVWFAARPLAEAAAADYSLLGCTVSPGFEFVDFEIARRDYLIARFPAFAALVESLT